ncbi:hypothetical protein SMI01S_30620 [Sphingobacterium mizutaii NBRC 14946 = DSM 11724]|uniref:Uncharacterized protein conserved in bacteria n=3 Tax=Sphingobacteriaceae TaxID=84566 RepID=A0AAJ4X8P9_9SPHI|nr:hypothetical protein SMI01S_30620 [Sphingobacterium mizutaii NBRC 14946 = DSM 11724]SDL72407.1 LPS export ABC transporter protein LptC [Sphingobacterium mizutaii]SNV41250.1 Uncharacterized protein conserved in bacteria [Sphingobacterium mizutaii]
MRITAMKISRILPLTIVLLGAILSIACENDTKDIDRLANIKQEEAVDISKDVTVVYSDSAKVKAELKAPEMRVYHDSTGNYEFKKGVLIIFFDDQAKEMQRVTSEYALQKRIEGLTEFRKNVVITKVDGTIIKTEELIYDEKNKKYYGSQPITAEYNDGRTSAQGTSFTADADFNDIRFMNGTAIHIPSADSQLPSFGN